MYMKPILQPRGLSVPVDNFDFSCQKDFGFGQAKHVIVNGNTVMF